MLMVGVGVFAAYQQGILDNLIKKPAPTPIQTTQPTITPSPDPTTDWETYTESGLGLTFKYPSVWTATKSPGQQLNIVVTPDPKNEKGVVPMQLSVEMANDYNGNIDFSTIQQAQTYYLKSLNSGAKIVNGLIVGGKPASRITGTLSSTGPGEGNFLQYTFVQLNEKVLTIRLGDVSIRDSHDQILSTFKFTGPSDIAPSPSN